MKKSDVERLAQQALSEAEAAMDAVEEAVEENLPAILNVLGEAEAARWLRTIADAVEHCDCEGEA